MDRRQMNTLIECSVVGIAGGFVIGIALFLIYLMIGE